MTIKLYDQSKIAALAAATMNGLLDLNRTFLLNSFDRAYGRMQDILEIHSGTGQHRLNGKLVDSVMLDEIVVTPNGN